MTFERYYEEAKVGDECVTPSITVTAAHIDTYADVSGDHTPLHVDEEYAKKSHFGARVAHGLLGLAIVDGAQVPGGVQVPAGDVARLDLGFHRANQDRRHAAREIPRRKHAHHEKPGWGIVVLPAELINQRGEVVQRGEHRLMIPRRPEASA